MISKDGAEILVGDKALEHGKVAVGQLRIGRLMHDNGQPLNLGRHDKGRVVAHPAFDRAGGVTLHDLKPGDRVRQIGQRQALHFRPDAQPYLHHICESDGVVIRRQPEFVRLCSARAKCHRQNRQQNRKPHLAIPHVPSGR